MEHELTIKEIHEATLEIIKKYQIYVMKLILITLLCLEV